jgi:hypothetical protein
VIRTHAIDPVGLVLGVALIVGAVCYLLDMLAAFLLPDIASRIYGFIVIPSAIAELSMAGYLLMIGVRLPRRNQHDGQEQRHVDLAADRPHHQRAG